MSNKLPWMPLDIPAYRNDTGHLTTLQHGAYLLALMHYWCHGPLPDDDEQLAAITKTDAKTWRAIKGVIRRFFQSDHNGELHQKRADMELDKARDISAKRKAAAGERWKPDANGHASASANGPPEPPKPDANASAKAPAKASANGAANADASASHTVPSTSTDSGTGESKRLVKETPLSPSLPARVSPAADGLDAVLSQAGVEPPEPGSAVVIPLRVDRTNDPEEPSADPLVSAHIKRATKALEMRIPYGEVRSAAAQQDACQEQPKAVGADASMGLRWQPADPVNSIQAQIAAAFAGCSDEQIAKARARFTQRAEAEREAEPVA